jgi:hypothetical protein
LLAIGFRPRDLELSCTFVNRLLFNRELSLTPNAKVAALLLDDHGDRSGN